MKQNESKSVLAKNALDAIPRPSSDACHIIGLVKKNGTVTGYELPNHKTIDKAQAIDLARHGGISGVGIAHRGNTEYLKSIPDGTEDNNLSNLPSVSFPQ